MVLRRYQEVDVLVATGSLLAAGAEVMKEFERDEWEQKGVVTGTSRLIRLAGQVQEATYDLIEHKSLCVKCKKKYEK